jgi:hypothetical protein
MSGRVTNYPFAALQDSVRFLRSFVLTTFPAGLLLTQMCRARCPAPQIECPSRQADGDPRGGAKERIGFVPILLQKLAGIVGSFEVPLPDRYPGRRMLSGEPTIYVKTAESRAKKRGTARRGACEAFGLAGWHKP